VLANQPQCAPLAAGEIISSGTLTPPPVIVRGDRIRAEVVGFDLAPVEVAFESGAVARVIIPVHQNTTTVIVITVVVLQLPTKS
jgi:hypothetical protein